MKIYNYLLNKTQTEITVKIQIKKNKQNPELKNIFILIYLFPVIINRLKILRIEIHKEKPLHLTVSVMLKKT